MEHPAESLVLLVLDMVKMHTSITEVTELMGVANVVHPDRSLG